MVTATRTNGTNMNRFMTAGVYRHLVGADKILRCPIALL
jgi:hypothetical protein